jgi:hypothetical protein
MVSVDPVPPTKLSTDAQYLAHSFWTPSNLYQTSTGWDVMTITGAINAHDSGSFWTSSALAVVVSRYPWIFGPLSQRKAPPLGLTREVFIPDGTDRGKSRIASREFSALMLQNEALFGDVFRPHALMGFSVLQDTWFYDPATKTQIPITNVWPTSAVRWNAYLKKLQAFTMDGLVDINDGDGKWRIVGMGTQPYIEGAIRSVAMPWAQAVNSDRNEAALSDYLGRLCPIAILPGGKDVPVIPPDSPEGKQTLAALKDLGKARSGGMFAAGTTVTTLANVDAGAAALFTGLLPRRAQGMAIALLGTDGTTTNPGGVYASPMFAGVALAKIREDVNHAGRAWTTLGNHYGEMNYGLTPESSPSYRWLLPDPTEAERRKAMGDAFARAAAAVTAERAAGLEMTPERLAVIYGSQGLPVPTMLDATAKAPIFAYHITSNIVAPDQVLETLGLPAMPGGVGSPEALAAHILAVRAAELDAAKSGKQAADPSPAPVAPAP